MKRFLIITCLLCVSSFSVSGQTQSSAQAHSIDSLFVNMPDSLLPLLSRSNRLDCCDFMHSKMRALVDNNLEGKSEMTVRTDSFIQLKTTESSMLEMRLLPSSRYGLVVCLVSSVYSPEPLSTVKFFTAAWQSLGASEFLPARADSLLSGKPLLTGAYRDSSATDASTRGVHWVSATLSAEKPTLTFWVSFDNVNYNDHAAAATFSKEKAFELTWNGSIFVQD